MTRRYACRMCGSRDHRTDRGCALVTDHAFLVERPAWIAKQRAKYPGRSKLVIDRQWRRKHGYCDYCPRKSKRNICEVCSYVRAGQPSRKREYRQRVEYPARSRPPP